MDAGLAHDLLGMKNNRVEVKVRGPFSLHEH